MRRGNGPARADPSPTQGESHHTMRRAPSQQQDKPSHVPTASRDYPNQSAAYAECKKEGTYESSQKSRVKRYRSNVPDS
jgi:hypothetical protein